MRDSGLGKRNRLRDNIRDGDADYLGRAIQAPAARVAGFAIPIRATWLSPARPNGRTYGGTSLGLPGRGFHRGI